MNLEVKSLTWQEVDLAALAAVALAARRASPFYREGQDLETFRNYVAQNIERWPASQPLAAFQDGNLVGWLGLILEDPLRTEIWRWQPFITPKIDSEPPAIGLLQAAVEIAREKSSQSLEVVCGFSKDQISPGAEKYYQRYLKWYQSAGLKQADKFVYLTATPEALRLVDSTVAAGRFWIRELQPGDQETLAETYFRAFQAGADRSFLEQTEQQRQSSYQGYFTDELNQGASMVLLEGEEVRGFSLVQDRKRVGDQHLALVAVAPAWQRQGWGRALISDSIRASLGQGHDFFSIGVDLANQAAYHLYLSLGFSVQSKLINHTWKNPG
jgi:ribosomal protein S18 acetylase RimI-like enzyme